MGKKHQKCPENGSFSPFVTTKFFSKNRALLLLYPYSVLTSCKILEKTNRRPLEIFKDGPTDGPTGLNQGPKNISTCKALDIVNRQYHLLKCTHYISLRF